MVVYSQQQSMDEVPDHKYMWCNNCLLGDTAVHICIYFHQRHSLRHQIATPYKINFPIIWKPVN